MKKLLFLFSAVLLLPLAAGEIMNLNSRMELGVPGRGVPGYYFDVNKAHIDVTSRDLAKNYNTVTVPDGRGGMCMKIPGYTGVSFYQLESSEMILPRDGEVEISFDVKIGADENGVLHPVRPFSIDFRCYADGAKDKYYPMLRRFSFRPGTEWKTIKRRFKIKAYTYYYHIWVLPEGVKSGGTVNSLYLDNFTLRYVDGKDVEPEEYAVIPDDPNHVYAPGKTAALDIRARINSTAQQIDATLEVKKEYNSEKVARIPVKLVRGKDGTYTANCSFKFKEYGSFTTELVVAGKKLRGINGSLVSLHPVAKHPYRSYGWRIGCNTEGPWAPARSSAYDSHENFRIISNSLDRNYLFMKLAGNSLVRVWCKWRMVEAEEGDFRPGIVGPQMELLKKYDLEPLFCLVGNFPVHGGEKALERFKKNPDKSGNFPKYLWKYYYQSEIKNMGSILPPMDIYKKYLDFVYKTWGKDIRLWEMSNEPGLNGFPAKAYIDYLKFTNKYLKERNPSAFLLGNGVTGDFGMNVVKWCDQLNAADPNYVDHLDAVAFHPYACGLDYYNGSRGLYKQTIQNISSTLSKPKEMWNTECYYLPTVRTKQINNGRELSRYGVNELQRHFLDGFCNGVVGTLSPTESSYFQRANRIVDLVGPTEMLAAQNALSYLLTDMTELKEINVNSQTRSGVFSNKSGSKAMGFIYDMRPAGSVWTPGKANVKLLDCFGNIVKSKAISLSFEPYYVSGTRKEVEKALRNSTFKVDSPVELFGRYFFGNLFAEAVNVSGTSGIVETQINGVPFKLDFGMKSDRTVVDLGKVKTVPANIKMFASAASHVLPYNTTLSQGSKISLSANKKDLKLVCEVADSNITAAEKDALWTGSCVELFIDPAPFEKLAVEKVPIMQYIFAAVPSTTGVTFKAVHNKASKAVAKVTRTAKGYTVTAVIPLDELPSGNVWGIDAVITRTGVKEKESIGNDPKNSYCKRGHFHLFKVPVRNVLLNSDFSSSSFGDPAVWCYTIRDGVSVDCNDGIAVIKVDKPHSKPNLFGQHITIAPGKFKRGTLQVKMKYDDVKTVKSGRGWNGVQMVVNYTGNNASYSFDKLKKDITGSADWQVWQMDFIIPSKASYLNVQTGLGKDTTGTVSVDQVNLILNAE